MHRRRFLQAGASVGVGVALAGRPLSALGRLVPIAPSVATGAEYVPVAQFPSGVLSGDPTTDGVVLWTRIDPAVAGAGIAVGWEIGTDVAFGPGTVLADGTAMTEPASDHTVHVEPSGLPAGTTLWYRFTVAGTTSPVGRTKTLPTGAGPVRLASFSCERYVHGYYAAHADLAARALDPATDVDLVICLDVSGSMNGLIDSAKIRLWDIVNELAKLKGQAFDERYMEVMTDEHRKMEDVFKQVIDRGQDDDLKSWAQKNLPVIQEHLEHAKQTEKKVD